MREYIGNNLQKAVCNCCKKELTVQNGVLTEGVFSIEYAFGYFSNKDEEVHKFDLCEACYEKWIATFKLPVEIAENTELL